MADTTANGAAKPGEAAAKNVNAAVANTGNTGAAKPGNTGAANTANATAKPANATAKPANATAKPANANTGTSAPPPEDPSLVKFKGLLKGLEELVDGKADCKTLEKLVKDLIQAGEQNVKSAKNKGALKEADLVPLAKQIEKLIPSIQEACKVGANLKKALPAEEEAGADAPKPSAEASYPPPVETKGGGYRRKRKTHKHKVSKKKTTKSRRRV